MKTTTKRFTDEENTIWTVRIVYEGDRFGLDNCLTHDSADPLIEFYDRVGFVSRYYASTLLEDRRYGLSFDEHRGVDVHTMRQITAWIAPRLGTAKTPAAPKLTHNFTVGDFVEGGELGTEDYDTGTVMGVSGDQITVAWGGSNETTTQRADTLRHD